MPLLDPILSPVLQPLLNFSPFWGTVILAFVITLLITLSYKYLTDQKAMKRLKEEQKDFQKRMKALRDQPDEMMKVQKEAMKTNMEYMKHSFKATLITFIPIILIFGWMNAHLAFEPIYPGERFSITAEFGESVRGVASLEADEAVTLLSDAEQEIEGPVTWNLESEAGEHFVTVKVGNDQQSKKILITKELKTEPGLSSYDHSDITTIQINYNKLKPLGNTSLFGWKPGWLGIYIIVSIVFSIGLRKLLKIY